MNAEQDRFDQGMAILARAQREVDMARAKGWLKLFIGFVLGWVIAGIVGTV